MGGKEPVKTDFSLPESAQLTASFLFCESYHVAGYVRHLAGTAHIHCVGELVLELLDVNSYAFRAAVAAHEHGAANHDRVCSSTSLYVILLSPFLSMPPLYNSYRQKEAKTYRHRKSMPVRF
jgi:hypothetical protein